MNNRLPPLPAPPARGAGFARLTATLACAIIVVAALARRFDVITTETALVSLGVAFVLALAALAAVIFTLRDVWRYGRHGFRRSAMTMVFVVLAFSPLIGGGVALAFFPPIDDVSTDPSDPPSLPARTRHVTLPVALVAPPDRVAELQTEAYPDIVPLPVDLSTVEAFALARATALELGWRLDSAEEPKTETSPGRIEAEARSLVLGIPEDLVITLAPTEEGTRIDLRSASRYPLPDLGSNARNIRDFVTKFLEVSHRPAPG